ncbi:MAG: carbamoyltransferase HypF [Gammaproteobacteria bacterium]|nr:carbamoyltransferase HypF [Gammaproteobacteria bacterium]
MTAALLPASIATHCARSWVLAGRVQGVGFRPFVYRLAHDCGICGWVRNRSGQVEIFAQGDGASLERFGQRLLSDAPPLAQPQVLSSEHTPLLPLDEFSILPSTECAPAHVHLAPDYFTCADCLAELHNPGDRRYRYPFINCTQCGPRYTIIRRLPYDRANTTLAGFALCAQCRAEYQNPLDRRFHAEPLACPACGPQLSFKAAADKTIIGAAALAACVAALREGEIIAVKGVGGYHLLCDARSDAAVLRLRATKPRPHKPLAVMFPLHGADGLDAVREAAEVDAIAAQLLRDPMRPIVLVTQRSAANLSGHIAPGLDEIGALLPYSPLHHLLLEDFGAPLVATSANVSGEPVLTANEETQTRLAHVTDAFLHHDRPIQRPADDAVFRIIAGQPRPLRLGRGGTPLELELPFELSRPVLATGGHMKNTIALAWHNRVVISPHIGDLGTPRGLEVFEQVIEDLQTLYGVRAEKILCDAHPDYAGTRWARRWNRRSGLPLTQVWHHHAHASGVAGEFPAIKNWLVFTWDGVGLGEDGTLWGGEALLGGAGHWWRAASLRPFHLPGGERSAREPWRSALALCWESNQAWHNGPAEDTALLLHAWQRRINAPQTSAVGRLFDAAAALLGLVHTASFEGQGPMTLEAVSRAGAPPVNLPLQRNAHGLWRTDWAPLVPLLLDEHVAVAERASIFHASLAHALLQQARMLRDEHGVNDVGLSGGVFQNRILAEHALRLLQDEGFAVHLPRRVPCNDGGLSYGQIIEAAQH